MFTDRLLELLKERGLKQKDLIEAIGIGKNQILYWKKNGVVPNKVTQKAIADYFGVSVEYLLGQTDDRSEEKTPSYEEGSNAIFLDNNKIRMIPLFESVSAGFGAYPDEQVIDYIPLYISNPHEAKETLCITVRGDSMYPKIEDGDVIQVHKQDSVDSGRIAVVLIDGMEAVVKKVTYGADWIELHSINPEYKTRRFEGQSVTRVRVLGQVKKIIKSV